MRIKKLNNRPMVEKLNRENQVFARSNSFAIGIVLGLIIALLSILFFAGRNTFWGFFFLILGAILVVSFILGAVFGKKDMPPEYFDREKPQAIFKGHDE